MGIIQSEITQSETIQPENALKQKSNDVGWDYGELVDPKDYGKIKCKLCGKILRGGVFRLKQHIGGIKRNVTSCSKSTPLDKKRCKEALQNIASKKRATKEEALEVIKEINLTQQIKENVIDVDLVDKAPHILEPIDAFAWPINPDSPRDVRRKVSQQNINDVLFKNRTNDVHAYLARWVYESGIPFTAINNDSFHRFVEAVGQFGSGYIPPSQYQLREPLLKQEVDKTRESLKEHEEEWKKSGCTIMTDAWSDRKRRSIMNLCVNCKLGTSFLDSVEDSIQAHTSEYIFEYVDKHIEEVGPKNVIQIVTDNASNNMAATKILKEKRPTIFWSSCATHTLNLIFEGIGKTPKFKSTIDKTKALTTFIYAHHKSLALMRKYTHKRDIVRPGVTGFASAFLTMESMLEKKEKLKFMFSSVEWDECKLSTTTKGIKSNATIFSPFWMNMASCVDVFKPLVKVLRLVDGD